MNALSACMDQEEELMHDTMTEEDGQLEKLRQGPAGVA